MNKMKELRSMLSTFPVNVNILLFAVLASNIGNAIQTIAMSKWLYDKTGSALAFGGIILLDYLVSFLIQFISGAVIDRSNPKKAHIVCDLARGIIIILLGICLKYTSIAMIAISVSASIISLINSVYRSCYFKLIPMLVQDTSKLLRINGIYSTVIQAGLLVGTAIVAPVLALWGASTAIIINGITFLLSAIVVGFVKLEYKMEKNLSSRKVNQFFNDWNYIFKYLCKDKSLIWHILLSTGDIMVVNFFNILLVPVVTRWYHNNAYSISLFDGCFTIGAIVVGMLISKISNKLGLRLSSWLGLTIQGLLFFLLCMNQFIVISAVIIFFIGFTNGYSGLIYQTALQKRISHDMKGRIASFKNLVISVTSLILIPIVSKFLDISITYGLLCSTVIILIYGCLSFAINKLKVFGDNYLTSDY